MLYIQIILIFKEFYLIFEIFAVIQEVLKHLDKPSYTLFVYPCSHRFYSGKNHRLKPVSKEKRRIRRSEGRDLSVKKDPAPLGSE